MADKKVAIQANPVGQKLSQLIADRDRMLQQIASLQHDVSITQGNILDEVMRMGATEFIRLDYRRLARAVRRGHI